MDTAGIQPAQLSSRSPTTAAAVAGRDAVVVAVEPGFDFASRDYARLHARSAATAFQHPSWLTAFNAVLAPARGARPVPLTLRDRGGRLLGVVPLILRRKGGVRLLETTDLGVGDYAAPVLDPALPDARLDDAELRRLVAEALPPHDVLRIRPIRAEHVAAWRRLLPGEVETLDFSAHAVTLADGYAAWREQAAAKSLLGRLARAEKQVAKNGGARLSRLGEPGEIAAAIAFIAQRRAGRFEGDPIQEEPVRDFYAAAATAGAADGSAALYRLDIGGAPAGMVFGLRHKGAFNYLLIGCDYDVFGRCSPGLVLYDRIIREIADVPGSAFDFTIGDEPFKRDFGTVATPMAMITAVRGWRGRLALAAQRARDDLRRRKTATGKDDRE